MSGGGFDGVWGVYPFLPSGTIVASDIDSGLYVYTPTYVRACYFEGLVRDSLCNSLLNNVRVELIGTTILDSTDFTGNFKTGTPDAGTYSAVFSKAGYVSQTIPVTLVNGQITNVNIKLLSNSTVSLNGVVTDTTLSLTLPGSNISFSNTAATFTLLSGINGAFSNCATVAGQYNVVSGLWGYETKCFDTLLTQSNPTLDIYLAKKIQDDFSFDYGWTVNTNATTGAWVRGIPVGTSLNSLNDANPGNDASDDCSDKAYVTGNSGGGAGTDDLDNGVTFLNSPQFDLSTYVKPIVHYSRWFFNDGGSGNPNDSMHILLSNGITEVELEFVTANSFGNSSWINKAIDVSTLLPLTTSMQLRVIAADVNPGHIVEAGFDNFYVTEGSLGVISKQDNKTEFSVVPNPSTDLFTVNFVANSLSQNARLLVTDVCGKELERIRLNDGQISFGKNLLPGIYFVSLWDDKTISTKKIVKF